MASRVEAMLEPSFESPLDSGLERGLDAQRERGSSVQSSPGESQWETERHLAALCREGGLLRAVLARIALRLVMLRAWERLSFARLSDYARECLGISGRSVWSLAEVGARLKDLPLLEQALVSGTLGWTKVRLLARLPEGEDEEAWIGYARQVTAEELSKVVRAVDRGSIEAGASEEGSGRSRLFAVRCSSLVRGKLFFARGAAARAAGRMLHLSEAAELIAAEVLSVLPIEEETEACEEAGLSWSGASEAAGDEAQTPPPELRLVHRSSAADGNTGFREGRPGSGVRPPWRAGGAGRRLPRLPCGCARASTSPHPPPGAIPAEPSAAEGPSSPDERVHLVSAQPRPSFSHSGPGLPLSFPPELASLLDGLDEADAFELDERFRRAISLEQRLDARIAALLAGVWGRFTYRARGYPSQEAYARERLGIDPTRARALVRLERTAALSETFARAWRTGALSWVKAHVLVPLVRVDPLGEFLGDWVHWAGRVTVRRLEEDVERAVFLAETDPAAFRRGGGLPPEARDGGDREIGAQGKGTRGDLEAAAAGVAAGGDRETGAQPGRPQETCWARFIGPPDVVQLFKAVLCTVRRRMGRQTRRLPTAGEALDVMLDHALSTWGALDEKVAARHKVFARDGWRCAAPGCSSMQNLHDHHIRFRSAQGTNALENRITLCAFHHLRGVHAGLLRCGGRAPDGLRWEMGIRPDRPPRLAYRSGDVRVGARNRPLRPVERPGTAAAPSPAPA